MQTSNYVKQALLYKSSHATDQSFESKTEALFQRPGLKPIIEVHHQGPRQQKLPGSAPVLDCRIDSDCSSVRPSPLDRSRCSYLNEDPPPTYDNSPGLLRQDIRDIKDVQQIETETRQGFRICFIRQVNSMSRLLVTRKLFEAFMLHFRVLPQFWEYVLLFGAKFAENEMSPPQLRFRMMAADKTELRTRCSAGFECAYGLRFAELNKRGGNRPWSIRQTAIHHKYKAANKSSSWVMIAASEKTQSSLDLYARSCTDLASLNPFEFHVLILDSALSNWRSYIIFLTERLTHQSDKVLVASIDGKDPAQLPDVEERQHLKELEDQILDVILVLDSTNDTILSLLENYRRFRQDPCVWEETDDGGYDAIEFAFQEKLKDVSSSRKKVQTLHAKLKSTIDLLSSLLDLGNGHSLRQLAEESRQENLTMRNLTEKSTQDGTAVKVLTMITLIYLPATVVSNFFSTQFVTQKQEGNNSHVVLLSNAWLFAAICVPLTLGTLIVWWAWVRCQVPSGHSIRQPMALQAVVSSGLRMRRPRAGLHNRLTEPRNLACDISNEPSLVR